MNARTSTTRPASAASSPMPRTTCAVMSAASARFMFPAAAKSRSAGVAAITSLTLKPALARNDIASPASDAVYTVVDPSFLACVSNRANVVSLISRRIDLTSCILNSKSENTAIIFLTATVKTAAPIAAPARPIFARPPNVLLRVFLNLLTALRAFLKPVIIPLVSAWIFILRLAIVDIIFSHYGLL